MWTSSSAPANGSAAASAASRSAPTAVAAVNASAGRRRLPPANTLYRTASWSRPGPVPVGGRTRSRYASTRAAASSRIRAASGSAVTPPMKRDRGRNASGGRCGGSEGPVRCPAEGRRDAWEGRRRPGLAARGARRGVRAPSRRGRAVRRSRRRARPATGRAIRVPPTRGPLRSHCRRRRAARDDRARATAGGGGGATAAARPSSCWTPRAGRWPTSRCACSAPGDRAAGWPGSTCRSPGELTPRGARTSILGRSGRRCCSRGCPGARATCCCRRSGPRSGVPRPVGDPRSVRVVGIVRQPTGEPAPGVEILLAKRPSCVAPQPIPRSNPDEASVAERYERELGSSANRQSSRKSTVRGGPPRMGASISRGAGPARSTWSSPSSGLATRASSKWRRRASLRTARPSTCGWCRSCPRGAGWSHGSSGWTARLRR